MLINIWRVGVRRMGTDPFQWCPVTGQGAMGTNWIIGSTVWTWGRTSLLWGWQSTGTGCPEGMWSLLLWRYWKPAWTRSCAICSRWPCFGRRVALDDPQKSLPTPTILWFCDQKSVSFSGDQKVWRFSEKKNGYIKIKGSILKFLFVISLKSLMKHGATSTLK